MLFRHTFFLFAAATCLSSSLAAPENFDLRNFQTKASFELTVDKSKYLKPGASKIQSQSAVVYSVHGLMPGKSDGLRILFFAKPITETTLPDVLNNQAKELQKGDHAELVLYLDKQNNIQQANLMFVVPGTTVTRTIAWKPDDLKKYFSQANLKDRHLILKTKGTYSDSDAEETLKLSWDIELDLPVFREIKK